MIPRAKLLGVVKSQVVWSQDMEPITSVYRNDYNIEWLHQLIISKIQVSSQMKIPSLAREIDILKTQLTRRCTILERGLTLKRLNDLTKELEEAQDYQKRLDDYHKKTDTIVNEYLKEKGGVIHVDFMECNTGQNVDSPLTSKRVRLIKQFLTIAKEYIAINIYQDVTRLLVCSNCSYPLENHYDMDNEIHIQACPSCGLEYNRLKKIPLHSKEQVVRNDKETKDNFKRAISRFQGKQNLPDKASLYEKLDKYFRSYGLVDREKAKTLPLNADGERVGTDKKTLFKALKAIKEPKYSHSNLICHEYWGWTLPNIAHLEQRLLDNYTKMQKALTKVITDRNSSINVDYLLFKHLEILGYPCKREDFKMVDTPDILDRYENYWIEGCRYLNEVEGDNSIRYIALGRS